MKINEPTKLLVAALRSGEFKQTDGILRNFKGEFDALGVACEVYRRTTGDGQWRGIQFQAGGESKLFAVPTVVRDWFDWETNVGDEGLDLLELNDSSADFNRIADAIERGRP